MNLNTKTQIISKTTAILTMLLFTSLSAMHSAQAGVAPGGWVRSSTVNSIVTNNNNGTWTYGYTVNNTSQFTEIGRDPRPFLVDWELPWFGDAGINLMSIASPSGWFFNIETIGTANSNTGWDGVASWQNPLDPFYAGAASPFTGVTQVLHWYSECWAASAGDRSGRIGCEFNLQDAIAPGG